jgi:hypothetical protein
VCAIEVVHNGKVSVLGKLVYGPVAGGPARRSCAVEIAVGRENRATIGPVPIAGAELMEDGVLPGGRDLEYVTAKEVCSAIEVPVGPLSHSAVGTGALIQVSDGKKFEGSLRSHFENRAAAGISPVDRRPVEISIRPWRKRGLNVVP